MGTPSQAVQVCEAILRSDLEYNQAHKILPSVNRVIERMLARRNELSDAYEELHASLSHRHRALEAFFDVFTSTPMAWSPEKMSKARHARKELIDINTRIAAVAEDLAQLLTRRDEIKETSGFSCETFYHALDALELAAESEGNYLFEWHVKEGLDALRYQYDLKYWPPLSAVVEAIGEDARNAEVHAQDPATASATESRRPGLSDFLKAYFTRVKDYSISAHGFIPNDFSVSDNTLASLVNCALDLDVDKLIDSDFVKRFRQRERER
ncbi:hypothetical protein HKW98_13690 [Stutzerimonas urumqiensis]|uniref:hypothetical protein n=1 Tax=Stutzerimonas urumqiensis TaxID=638269 RepID=UPI003BA84721